MKLLPSLRALVSIRRSLARLADAAERIADRMDGRPAPPLSFDEAPPETVVAYTSPEVAAAAYEIEDRLRGTLHRDPSPEEILEEMAREAAALPGAPVIEPR